MILTRNCKTCGKEFTFPHWRVKTALFCSPQCRQESFKADNNVKCFICGKEFHMKPSRIKKHKQGEVCCSRKCLAEYKKIYFCGENNHQFGLKGDKNPTFKGEEITSINHNNKEIRVYAPNHPYRNKAGRVLKHRLIVEQNHFLFDEKFFETIDGVIVLKKQFNVHHKDGNHSNNDISNLQIVTRGEHTSIHNKQKIIVRDKLGRISKIIKIPTTGK